MAAFWPHICGAAFSDPFVFRGHCPLALFSLRALHPHRIAPKPLDLRAPHFSLGPLAPRRIAPNSPYTHTAPERQFARPAFWTPLCRLRFLAPHFRARALSPRLLAPLRVPPPLAPEFSSAFVQAPLVLGPTSARHRFPSVHAFRTELLQRPPDYIQQNFSGVAFYATALRAALL